MTFNDAVQDFKSRQIPQYMLTPAANGKGYVCVSCGNGTHGGKNYNATLSKNGTRLLCGKCKGGSYIDVACKYYGIDTTNFSSAVRELCKQEGILLDNQRNFKPARRPQNKPTDISDNKKIEDKSADERKQKEIAAQIMKESRLKLDDFIARCPEGKWRGISGKILKYLNWGFSENYNHPSNNYTFSAITIPYDNGGLFARKISDEGKSNILSGVTTLHLPENPKFVLAVESSIDGASILQACGTTVDFAIIAANGTPNKFKVVDRIIELFPKRDIPVAVAFDEDIEKNGKHAGQDAAVDALKRLVEASFTACTINITKTPGIDLNDVLKNSNGEDILYKMVNSAVALAQVEFKKTAAEIEKKLFGENFSQYFKEKFLDTLEQRKIFADRKTGFKNLDEEIGIFLPGFYVIGGLPALGKTTFSYQLVENVARQGETCIFVSYEMGKEELYSKSIARAVYLREEKAGKSIHDKTFIPLTSKNILQSNFYDHKPYFDEILENLQQENLKLYIWEEDNAEIDNLIERLEKICAKCSKPPFVVIDYLQILASNSESIKAGIDVTLRKLKIFQRKTKTTFIVISSLNRNNYNTDISFESFKESGGIEYTADVIWGLQFELEGERNHGTISEAKKETPRKVELKCLKNRFGGIYDVGFYYFPQVDLFRPNFEYGPFTDYTTNESGATIPKKKRKGKHNENTKY